MGLLNTDTKGCSVSYLHQLVTFKNIFVLAQRDSGPLKYPFIWLSIWNFNGDFQHCRTESYILFWLC